MSNTNTNTLGLAFENITAGAETLRNAGFTVDFRILFTTEENSNAGIAAVLKNMFSNAEANDAPAEQTNAPIDPVDARIGEVTGKRIYVQRSRKTSGGYKICNESVADKALVVNEGNVLVGYVNVYKKSLGTDIHATEAKADRYASEKVVATLPVYAA